MADAPPFDPTQPFEPVGATAAPSGTPPPFDPTKPFEDASGAPASKGWGSTIMEGLKGLGRGLTDAPGDILAGGAAGIAPTPQGSRNPLLKWLDPDLAKRIDESENAPSLTDVAQRKMGLSRDPNASTTGKYAGTISEAVGNPVSYVGEGGLLSKAVTAGISGAGSQAGQDIGGPVGGIVGGLAAPTLATVGPRALARAATPYPISAARQDTLNTLRAEGIEPTAGMASGSPALKRAETTLGDAPFGGGSYTAAHQAVMGQLTQYVSRQMGENANRITPEVMQAAEDHIGDRFDRAAQGLPVHMDPRFGNDLVSINRDLMREGLPPDTVRRITQQIDNITGGFVTQNPTRGRVTPRTVMDGDTYQALTRRDTPLDRAIKDPDPNVSYYATRVRAALDDAMERTAMAPGTRPGVGRRAALDLLRQARSQWFAMITARGAVIGPGEQAAEGLISPQKLRQALTSTADRKTSYALGRSNLSQVARSANEVMGSLPDSNTAQRSLISAIPSAVIGGVGGALSGHGSVGDMLGIAAGISVPGLAGRALMSRPAQAYLRNQRFAGYLRTPQTRMQRAIRIMRAAAPNLMRQGQP